MVRNPGSRSCTGLQKGDCRVRRLLTGYDALLTVPDCQEDSASAWSWIFHRCFLGSWMRFTVAYASAPQSSYQAIQRLTLFERKCRRRPHLVRAIVLPFGTENLYEPKERLLITQKRGIHVFCQATLGTAEGIDSLTRSAASLIRKDLRGRFPFRRGSPSVAQAPMAGLRLLGIRTKCATSGSCAQPFAEARS
jgi:hypothetical protein